MKKIIEHLIKAGAIVQLISVVFLSFGINVITSLKNPFDNSINIIGIFEGLSFLICGIIFFFLGARINQSISEGERTYYHPDTDKEKYGIIDLAIIDATEGLNSTNNRNSIIWGGIFLFCGLTLLLIDYI